MGILPNKLGQSPALVKQGAISKSIINSTHLQGTGYGGFPLIKHGSDRVSPQVSGTLIETGSFLYKSEDCQFGGNPILLGEFGLANLSFPFKNVPQKPGKEKSTSKLNDEKV